MPLAVLDKSLWGIRDDGLGQSVMVKCPNCKLVGKLSHNVDEKGMVEGALSCPTIGCSFEYDVQLAGWSQRHTAHNGEMMVIPIPQFTDEMRRKLDASRKSN